jgi:hypothetical protein
MLTQPLDVAKIRLDNALALFDEFVRATVKHPDAATLRGLERRFAERVLIQPSYWSQIKSRSRQIGERLARQFELCCHKPGGWMDQPHVGVAAGAGFSGAGAAATVGSGATAATATPGDADASAPKDDDERFIVGLVLTYYRRHPQRARTRLLDLLGEVLTPPPDSGAVGGPAAPHGAAPASAAGRMPAGTVDEQALWRRSQTGVAPLKKRK